ncbi:metalloprotease TldD [Aquicella lusitana]|uniref:Microcin-processing peptidase 2 n=1 Tax=Aquicella lusitana TaxID=254246 RepID=A0A370GYN4_9COXI|nr:metalloprotease TldD [Aquicella lusitana]RDI48776.1 microcin-processing peptidase 2 [Aquicella lusitana]VVC73204.1 Metalloprotease TldD [Aquicella lusitana]
MTDVLKIVRHDLLDPAGLTDRELQNVIHQLAGRNVDYADLYFQSTYSESWMLEDGIIKGGSFDIDRGVGVRAMSGEKTGFAYADDIVMPALLQAASAARSIVKQGGEQAVQAFHKLPGHQLYQPVNPLHSLSENEKVNLLQRVDRYIRQKDPRIVRVSVSLAGEYETILVMASDGHLAADVRPLVRLNISLVVEQEGRRESGYAGGGGRFNYQHFLEGDLAFQYADEALRQALVNLEAVDAPAGPMTVVLGPGWPGVLLHEAVGHGLEGDFNRKGISAYSGSMGKKVASDLCTIVDNGTLEHRRGSLNVDDEGIPTQNNVLIENGILRNYMMDKRNARLMGVKSTGNGRRESYAHLPLPRMTNTYMLPGKSAPEEIIASVKKGIYAVNFGGGQVDITSGKFVFSASEAYLIENGKLGAPVKGATLIGNGPDALTKVSMVGNDLKLDTGVGVCGKDGQSVPVGVGQPTLRVDELTVGGTKA